MPKKKSDFICTGCSADLPDEEVAESGWYTVIRAWKGGTKTYLYCPACHAFQYGAPIKKSDEHAGDTWH